jgi:serine/threonine protein kinase
MSTVYLARQSDLQREARLAGSLGRPNIVTVYDYFGDRGRLYTFPSRMRGPSWTRMRALQCDTLGSANRRLLPGSRPIVISPARERRSWSGKTISST